MDDAFWTFSNAVYGEYGVRDECLALQEQCGLDVNLVLFCAYAGAVHGISLTENEITAAQEEVAPWHEEVVKPLRAARRNLKPFELKSAWPFAAQAARLRNQVKTVEIESEHIEQCMLETILQTRITTSPRHPPHVALARNLRLMLSISRVGWRERDGASATDCLRMAALKHAFLR
jgi:uncharacterized protein (TIGR02444 family)